MKPKLPLLLIGFSIITVIASLYMVKRNPSVTGKKICCGKKCATEPQPVQGGSSPEDLMQGAINRLIVSTIK